MDKKSTVIGILLIGLAVGLMFFNAKRAPEAVPARSVAAAERVDRKSVV